MPRRNVTAEQFDPAERYALYRLCDCTTCGGNGKVEDQGRVWSKAHWSKVQGRPPVEIRCSDCRGEGRIRQEVAACASPEAVGVALVTLAREGEFSECPIGLLDRGGEVGQKWLVRPWMPSARNVTDAARTLAKSKSRSAG